MIRRITNPRWAIVRQALSAKGMSFDDLAGIIGCSRRTLYNIVGGWNRSSKGSRKIEEVLGLESGSLAFPLTKAGIKKDE